MAISLSTLHVLVPSLFQFFVTIRTHLRNVDNSCGAVKLLRSPLNVHFSFNMSLRIILATSHIIFISNSVDDS